MFPINRIRKMLLDEVEYRNTNIATTMNNDMRVGCDRPRRFYLRILDSALAVVAVRL